MWKEHILHTCMQNIKQKHNQIPKADMITEQLKTKALKLLKKDVFMKKLFLKYFHCSRSLDFLLGVLMCR